MVIFDVNVFRRISGRDVYKMCNKKRDLIIIGNGFDLSLNVNSNFNNYFGLNTINDYRDSNSKYYKFYQFVNMFQGCQRKLDNDIFNIKNKFNIELKPLYLKDDDGNNVTHPIKIQKNESGKWKRDQSGNYYEGEDNNYYSKADFILNYNDKPLVKNGSFIKKDTIRYNLSDYFNIQMLSHNGFKITNNLFRPKGSSKFSSKRFHDALDGRLKELNEQIKSSLNKLKVAAGDINTNYTNGFNFWNLLMLLDIYIERDTYNSINGTNQIKGTHLRKWCDIENTIKDFLVSTINIPIIHKKSKDKYYRINHEYHDIWYYLPNVSVFREECFDEFTYINRYFDLLKDILVGLTESYVSDGYYDVYKLYNHILYTSDYNELLLHYENKNVTSNEIDDVYNIVNPVVFLIIYKLHYCNSENFSNNSRRHLFTFLHLQLNKFEEDFSKYLQVQINNKQDYKQESNQLLDSLALTSNLRGNINNYSVLDFNYTPLDPKNIECFEHIHGSLHTDNIVIGVGEQEINNLRPLINKMPIDNNIYYNLYSFTKTYRLFAFNRNVDEKFLKNIKNIVFYGHSLGINDYPYFEALFDHFKLYSNPNINLIFCYSKHGGKTKEMVKSKLVPRVVNMLRRYSKATENKLKAQNLMAKMLVENRIKFHCMN